MPPSFNSLLAIRSGAGVGLNHISTLKSNFDGSGDRCCIMFIMFEHVHTSYNDNYSFSNATLIQMHLNDFNENTHKTYDRKGYIAIVGYTLLLDLQLYAKEHDWKQMIIVVVVAVVAAADRWEPVTALLLEKTKRTMQIAPQNMENKFLCH